ncbi:hypothetical protein V8E53_004787 [Lactarius tabidus]
MAPKKSKSTLTKDKNRRRVLPRTEEDPGEDPFPSPPDPALFSRVKARVSTDDTRGTKHSATVSDEPNEDQDYNESETRKSVSPVGRRARFWRPASPRPKKRQRVGDDLDTAETALDDMWVAEGEDRCKPCKLVEREVCMPLRSARGSYERCVFCMDKSWPCNPPDSWLERVGSVLNLKQPPAQTDEVAMDDAPIVAREISGTAGASPPSISGEAAVRRQRGPQEHGGAEVQVALNDDDRLQRIETRLSAIEGHQEKLTAIQCAQQEMLLPLCRNHTTSSPSRLHSGFGSSAFTSNRPIDFKASSRFFIGPSAPRAVANDLVRREVDGPSQQNVGGPSSPSRHSAHAGAGPSAGTQAEQPKRSQVEAGRTQGSTREVFLHEAQNRNEEERRRHVKNDPDQLIKKKLLEDFEAIEARLLAINVMAHEMGVKLRAVLQR